MSKEHEKKEDEEEITINFSTLKETGKKVSSGFSKLKSSKHFSTILIIALIAIVILVSTIYRLYPTYLPITHDWAQSSIESGIKNQIATQIKSQNSALPDAQIKSMTDQQYQQYYAKNKQTIDSQINQQAAAFKSRMQDANGQTYLIAIDPYLWYSYAKWYERTGFFGNEVVNGQERFTLRNGRIGKKAEFVAPSAVIVLFDKLIKIFNPSKELMSSDFLIPLLLIALAIIPAFFLGKKLGGLPGGFFAAILFALSPTILGRTIAGFSDTDAYTFIFPFLTVWLFIEAIDSKTPKGKTIFSVLTGLSLVLFQFFWSGWWFTFDLIIGLIIVTAAYKIIYSWIKNKKVVTKGIFKKIKYETYILGIIILSTLLFAALLGALSGRGAGSQIQITFNAPLQPINFVLGFKGAAVGVGVGDTGGLSYPLWPNVFTTVAELNSGNSSQVISGGGGMFFFVAAILGVLLLLFKKKDGESYPIYGILLAVWFASTFYAGLVGIRFIALFAPVVAFGIAGLVGSLTGQRMKAWSSKAKIHRAVIPTIVILLGLIFLVLPQMAIAHNTAKNALPTYDDTWNNALMTIQNSSQKAIISSWWDFGHWFESMSERSVTFDGGDQGKRIYWIGNTLLTPNETHAVNELKMLNCGQEEGYNMLLNITKNKYKATTLIKRIVDENRADSKQTLLTAGLTDAQAESVLKYSHCSDLYDMYYITSEDMVGKAGVWGHFGSWDFNKAYMYYRLKNLPINQSLPLAEKDLGLTPEEAKAQYIAVQTIQSEDQANQWISTWPSYATQKPVPCISKDNITTCDYNLQVHGQNGYVNVIWRGLINETNVSNSMLVVRTISQSTGQEVQRSVVKPNAIAIADETGIHKTTFDKPGFGLDVTLMKNSDGTYTSTIQDPLLTESLFTKLFFMDGKYTTHFKKVFDKVDFRGQRIIVWKVSP